MGEGPDAEGSVNTEGCTDVKSTEKYIVGKRRRYNGKQRAKVEEIKKKMHSEQILKELFAEIGDNTVVGAGSVVTKDLPANVVAVSNPCRVLREINEHDREYYFKDHKIPEELLK